MASIFSLFLLFEILLFVFHNVYVAILKRTFASPFTRRLVLRALEAGGMLICVQNTGYNKITVAPPAERR